MIRIAQERDAEELLRIYSWYVEHTAITFEYDVPSVEKFAGRIRETKTRFPYLVAVREGRIVGYAYAGTFHARPAYDWAVETSIYVDHEQKRTGVGRELYAALEEALRLQHIINLNACIAAPIQEDETLDRNSLSYHEHLGYRFVGEFEKCGYKFDRWYNMVWMEKHIDEHPAHPLPMRPFPETEAELAALLKKRFS